MEAVRDLWTDERLDDLNHRVDSGFTEVSREFQALRLETRTEFAAVRSEIATEFAAVRSEMKAEFASVRSEVTSMRAETNSQFAAQNRAMVQLFWGMMTTNVIGFVGVTATILTQA